MKTYTHAEWLDEAKERFGADPKNWRFVCPACKTEQGISDFIEADVPKEKVEGYIAFSCIGRFNDKAKGCDWTLGGLFKIHEVEVIVPKDNQGEEYTRPCFAFAEPGEKVAVEIPARPRKAER